MPSNAALVHYEPGLSKRGIPAFDINASCLGFLAALDTLTWMVSAGRYKRIQLVAAGIASCGLNRESLESSAIFGDGAAAVIIEESKHNRSSPILASSLRTFSEGVHYCEIQGGGSRFHPDRTDKEFEPLTRFQMDGKKVFRLAPKCMPGLVQQLFQDARTGVSEIDWIVFHQASQLPIRQSIKRLNFISDRVVNIFKDYGNQVAASLPVALDIAIQDGRIRRGDKLLLLGTGAGRSSGGVVMEYR